MHRLAFDIGSNSVGSAWIDTENGTITTGTSVFPAGVDETDDKRGEPKNAKRRQTRRTRITLARRSSRKTELRLKLIAEGLLPPTEPAFRELLSATDPWDLRKKGLDQPLTPPEFGRVLLHLAQRRGALGLTISTATEEDADAPSDDGKVKKSIGIVRQKMLERKARTFGEFIAAVRTERVTLIKTPDNRRADRRRGPREYRDAVRNKASNYEHCADRAMIRHEFQTLWNAQKKFGGELSQRLNDELLVTLDDECGDSLWRHRGLLFGQRRQSWDLGTLGRCALEPTERCVSHADQYASRFLVVETVNNLRIIEGRSPPRQLTAEERKKILNYLSGPLGTASVRRKNTDSAPSLAKPKTTASVTDLRLLMGWGRATKTSPFRFNVENDEDRVINTDWFSREIIYGAVTVEVWSDLAQNVRDGINRALLKFDPDDESHAQRLREGLLSWGTLNEAQTEAVLSAWRRRPNIDAKRLAMSRRAVRNILSQMDREAPWPDSKTPGGYRWLTAIEARKAVAEDPIFIDCTTGKPLDGIARERYATGAKGSTARDRYYMRKHVLTRAGKPILDPDGAPLSEPPPAPLISNPVVRKAIHEVRRHLVAYMKRFGRKPDQVIVELSREARMGKMEADRLLMRNRLRNRIRNDIADELSLDSLSPAQQRAAFVRVILSVQQDGVCPLCGNTTVKRVITPRLAAEGHDCEVAHIIPRACGGHDGLSNIVLAHTKCNRDMNRRTPRDFWGSVTPGGFEAAMTWVEGIYREVERPKPSEAKAASGNALWKCYFTKRDDITKLEQFSKNVTDIQGMTARQDAATKYATRQVMSYLADALYDGKGLPERGGTRRVFATDGIWTSRMRREWGLFFDVHGARRKDIGEGDRNGRREKNRGDHRHHAIDAAVICCATTDAQNEWAQRERDAERAIPNSADEAVMEAYRRQNPLQPPFPFRSQAAFQAAVEQSVFGASEEGKPVCHRPVKRKLVGALHEETLLGPVVSTDGSLTGMFICKKAITGLKPNHLRMPYQEPEKDAIARLATQRIKHNRLSKTEARKWALGIVTAASYTPMLIDPPPAKSGVVRDIGLRRRIRECISSAGFDPDSFKPGEIKKLAEQGVIRQLSGVPIRSAVLLRTMSDPVIIDRRKPEYGSSNRSTDQSPRSRRAYIGGNNHHIELRVDSKNKYTGIVISAFEASQRKLSKLKAFRREAIPRPSEFKNLSRAEKDRLRPVIREIESSHPIVDRRDDDSKGGAFVMSLCEGETLLMRPKLPGGEIGPTGFFVVAKLEKPNAVVLVPHWDARSATERKDADGKPVAGSQREQFSMVPSDLPILAPEGAPLPIKVAVDPLGSPSRLTGD